MLADPESVTISGSVPFDRNAEIPAGVRSALPGPAQTIWRRTFNSELGRGLSEERAIRAAWSAVARAGFHRGASGRWARRKRAAKAERRRAQLRRVVPLWKDEEKRTVFGVVLVPDLPDSQGDVITKDEILAAVERFMRKRARPVGVQHRRLADAEITGLIVVPEDTTIAGRTVKAGSALASVKIHGDKTWEAVLQGRLTGFSIGGTGVREPLRARGSRRAAAA